MARCAAGKGHSRCLMLCLFDLIAYQLKCRTPPLDPSQSPSRSRSSTPTWINQSINQSNDQSIDQLINQAIYQSINPQLCWLSICDHLVIGTQVSDNTRRDPGPYTRDNMNKIQEGRWLTQWEREGEQGSQASIHIVSWWPIVRLADRYMFADPDRCVSMPSLLNLASFRNWSTGSKLGMLKIPSVIWDIFLDCAMECADA